MSSSSKSTILNITSIASIVASVVAIIYGLCLTAVRSISRSELNDVLEMQGVPQDGEFVDTMFLLAELGGYYSLFNVLEVVALTFVLLGKRIGFHLYVAAQIGCIGLLVMVAGVAESISYILWNAVWCLLYWNLIFRPAEAQKD
ncbi:MAG: hypothetical protein II375_02545 [Bacteroidales bacterium]|nr:hypothetical protein [Bacteroidales bacterium]